MQRLYHATVVCFLTVAIAAAGCGRTSIDEAAGSMASNSRGETGVSSTLPRQDQAVLGVVDEYIREHTAEGHPYYIDSSATEFAGFDDRITREDDHAVCLAKFVSDRGVYYIQFVLSQEVDRYVIKQVVLERLNDTAIGRTLYNRDALVL